MRSLGKSIGKKRFTLAARENDVSIQLSDARASLIALYGGLFNGLKEADKRLTKTVSNLKQAMDAKPIDRTLQVYELEYNKKLAIPSAGLFFSLLAFPLGLGAKRAGRTAGFGGALLLSTLYWGALFVGQTAGLRNLMSPWVAMWLPNFLIILATLAAWVFRLGGSHRSV